MSAELSEVTAVLSEQHQQVKALMEQVGSSQGRPRQAAFDQLRCLLAVHEAAEAEVVHPVIGQDLGSDEEVVTGRLAEEDQAAKAIAKLEQLEVDGDEFAAVFAAFQKAVIAHAEAEEHQELHAVVGVLDSRQRAEIVEALSQVPLLASTRSGPLTANGVSFTAMHRAARDHFRRSSTTSLIPAGPR